jgi:hypothetical protein
MATPTKRAARQIPRQRDEDEDEAPTPSRRAAAPVEEPEDDEAEDEGGEDKPSSHIRRGFSAARQVADSTSSFAQAFKLTEQIQVIKFLEDEPYASYTRHWIERMTPTGRSLRSYNCLKNFGKPTCPLCEAGDKAQAVSAFNIALIGDDGVPLLKTFDCGPKLLGIVENYARDPKVAPISKGYFLASRSGKKGTVNYQLVPIKAHSLSDDYDIEAPTPEEMAKLGLYDADIITMPKTKELEGIAAEIADEY